MIAFNFEPKTKMIFGINKEETVGSLIKTYSKRKVMVVYGKNSIVQSGLLARVIKSLKEAHIEYVLFGGAEPNPKLSHVEEGIQKVKEENVDFLLAVGGGSAIDTAKLIAVSYDYKGNPFDFNDKKVVADHALPLGVILTIAAAGSEGSTSCVITNDKTHCKKGFNSEYNRPVFAIYNPELTYTVSPYQTACGIVDIMMHTLERYFNPSREIEFSDELAIGLLKTVYKAGKVVMEKPNDYEARSTLMIASTFSHNGLTSIGKNVSMPVHQLEHALSGKYDFVAHGAGLSVLFPYWAMLYYKYDLPKFARLAKEVFEIQGEDESKVAYLGIVAIQSFFHQIGMPITFQELGVTACDYDALLALMFDGRDTIDSVGQKLDRKKAKEIFMLCAKEEVV